MVRLDLNIKPADQIHCFKMLDISSLNGTVLWNNYRYCIYPVQYSLFRVQSHTASVWTLFMTFITRSSGNHIYSMCSACCYEWLCCTFCRCCLQLEFPHSLLLCFPCASSCRAQLHKAYPTVIKVRALDSAGHGPGDFISIDNYLKLK